jgi:hypothetical protein
MERLLSLDRLEPADENLLSPVENPPSACPKYPHFSEEQIVTEEYDPSIWQDSPLEFSQTDSCPSRNPSSFYLMVII